MTVAAGLTVAVEVIAAVLPGGRGIGRCCSTVTLAVECEIIEVDGCWVAMARIEYGYVPRRQSGCRSGRQCCYMLSIRTVCFHEIHRAVQPDQRL